MPEIRVFLFSNFASALLATVGIVQFLGTAYFIASNYPEPYRWHRHFISDLGRRVTTHGHENTSNSELFALTCLLLGVSLLPFLLIYPSLFRNGRMLLRGLAISIAIGIIGIGQTPYDKYFLLHHVFLYLWIVPMAALAIAFPVLVWREGGSPVMLVTTSGVLVLSTLVYMGIGSRTGYVILQKVVVLVSISWFTTMMGMMIVVSQWIPSNRQRAIASQATWYIRKLKPLRDSKKR